MSRALGGYVGHIPSPSTSAAPGVWTLREASRYRRAGTWPIGVEPDPNFANVSLLLHMDGSNGSTNFVDSSGTPKTVTPSGNAQISTAQSKFGGASGYFDGSGDYITVPASDGLELGSGDFTIELWLYSLGGQAQYAGVISKGQEGSTSADVWNLEFAGDSEIGFYAWSVGGLGVITGISTNTWHHVAISRNGSTTRFFLDGVLASFASGSYTISSNANGPLRIGSGWYDLAGRPFKGYIEELRITKGVARYTANFTPPTAPFPDA